MQYFVYILECNDRTLYTGITTNIKRRLEEHNKETAGSRYTRGRTPVKIVYVEKVKNRSLASKREYKIKMLKRKQKESLILNARE